jgi:hypothetical protein
MNADEIYIFWGKAKSAYRFAVVFPMLDAFDLIRVYLRSSAFK